MNKPQPEPRACRVVEGRGATARGPHPEHSRRALRCCPRCGLGLDALNPITRAGYCRVCVFELTFPPAVQARLIADGRGPRFIMAHLPYQPGERRQPLPSDKCPECGKVVNRRGLGTHRASQHGVTRKTAPRLPKRSPHYDH